MIIVSNSAIRSLSQFGVLFSNSFANSTSFKTVFLNKFLTNSLSSKSLKTCGNCPNKICVSCYDQEKLCINCDEEYEEWVTSLQKLKDKTEKKKKYNYKEEAELDLLI